jgi:hypothetical protein
MALLGERVVKWGSGDATQRGVALQVVGQRGGSAFLCVVMKYRRTSRENVSNRKSSSPRRTFYIDLRIAFIAIKAPANCVYKTFSGTSTDENVDEM